MINFHRSESVSIAFAAIYACVHCSLIGILYIQIGMLSLSLLKLKKNIPLQPR